jgi:feruloyl-CoA synthase
MTDRSIQGSPLGPDFDPPEVSVERRADGSLLLRHPRPLEAGARDLGGWLLHWAATVPERLFLAERTTHGEWRRLSYGAAARDASAVAQALIDRGFDRSSVVMALSGNGIDHALLMLGALLAGVPFCPVSPAYSLISTDHARLRNIVGQIRPSLVFVDSWEAFRPALEALDLAGTELVCSSACPAGTPFSALLATAPSPDVKRRSDAVAATDVAKILFTSGSTAHPKGVLNTHGMLTANQQMLRHCWPFLERVPPVLVDWLPWHHTFGGNHNFNLVLCNGGTLFVDHGRPTAPLIERTVANLRDVSPNLYFSVPAGYAMLLPHLERDGELARRFLCDLRLFFSAAAALPQNLWDRLALVSFAHLGRRLPIMAGWGSTETAPLATAVHFPVRRADVIGLPVRGVEVKLAPIGARFELRVRGPNVTPGYHRAPELTQAAFDSEGFYRTGDAGKLLDPESPEEGLVFDGRLAEDFKLGTGTWVSVGVLRSAVLGSCSPLLQELVICGEERDEVGILSWPNPGACSELLASLDPAAAVDPAALVSSPHVRAAVLRGVRAHNREHTGASMRIGRILLLAEPPSMDAGELTDKGYVNQRAVRQRRSAAVDALFAAQPGPDVIVA